MSGVDMPREMWAMVDEFPFASPPEGVIPNFENPALVGGHSLTIATVICIVLLLLASSARYYAKARLIKTITLDDYLYIISLPLQLFTLSAYLMLDQSGAYGYHAWDFQIKHLTEPILAVTFFSGVFLPVTTWFIKTTLFCQLIAAFRPVKWLRVSCCVGIVVTFCYYLANFTVYLTACHPRGGTDRVSYLMGMAGPACAGKEGINLRVSVATGVFNVVSDLYILILPLPAVRKLKLSPRRKLGVYLIFSTGGLACIASILTLAFRSKNYGTADITVDSVPTMIFNSIELTVGLIVCCIAPSSRIFRSLFAKVFRSVQGSTSKESEDAHRQVLPMVVVRKHQPGGLSEIDTMKTFGSTMVEEDDYSSAKFLTTCDAAR